MTPEEFEPLLRHSPCAEFVAAVNALDETQRKSLAKVVREVAKSIKQHSDLVFGRGVAGDLEKRQARWKKWRAANPYSQTNMIFGLLACGSAKDAHRVQLWQVEWQFRDLLPDLLIARNPDWLDTWVNKQLDGEFPQLTWEAVRKLMHAGVIAKPTSQGYMRLFVDALRGYDRQHPASYVRTSDRLLAEPALLEDEVWRLFEFESHAFTTDWHARAKQGPENYETWSDAIVRLANDGHLDRVRLLDAIVRALQQDIKQNQLAAYGKLHDALQPDAAELKAREQAYLDLLVSPTGPVVAFAMRTLTRLQRFGELDGGRFLVAARPVFAHKAKGTAMQALKLAEQLVASDASLRPGAAELYIAAMSHASPDVQQYALGLTESGLDDDGVQSQFERQVPFLASRLQAQARSMLGAEDTAVVDDASDSTAIEQSIEALPDALRRIAGLGGSSSASMPAALSYDLLELPGVAAAEKLERVGTQEELLELAARLIEEVDSGERIETLLDGIARLGTDRGGNFRKLAAPLAQRIEQGGTSSYGLTAGWGGIAVAIIDLLMSWLTGRPYDSRRTRYYSESPGEMFAVRRIREIQSFLLRGAIRELLSTPTYRSGGWLEPADLVDRLLRYRQAGSEPLAADLMQALLRLAPGGRPEALRAAKQLEGLVARTLRFALGGDERLKRTDSKHAEVWLCAARARQPEGSVRELLAPIARSIPDMPGLLDTPDRGWSVSDTKVRGYRQVRIVADSEDVIEVEPRNVFMRRSLLQELHGRLTRFKWHKWPLAAVNARATQSWYLSHEMASPWRIEWAGMQQPLQAESFFAAAVNLVDLRSDQGSSRDAPVHAYFVPLFDPTRRWGEMANLLTCLGLVSRSADTQGFAMDALIPAIESGHADVDPLGRIFAVLFANDAYKLNRFEPAMTQVADVSQLHRWWVACLVDRVIVCIGELPKGVHYLYQVALECMQSLQAVPTESMIARLRQHKGSSKTAKLAKELLALQGNPLDMPPPDVIVAARRGRLEFARRFRRR